MKPGEFVPKYFGPNAALKTVKARLEGALRAIDHQHRLHCKKVHFRGFANSGCTECNGFWGNKHAYETALKALKRKYNHDSWRDPNLSL